MKAIDEVKRWKSAALQQQLLPTSRYLSDPDWRGIHPDSQFLYRTAYGDYNGTATVERSNHEAIKRDFPFLETLLLGYGFAVLYIDGGRDYRGAALNRLRELLTAVEELENYPLYDEEHLSWLEMELEHEAVTDWIQWDLKDPRLVELRDADEVAFRAQVDEAIHHGGGEFCIFEQPTCGYIRSEVFLPMLLTQFGLEQEMEAVQ